jgi:hypothetical protein
VRQGVAGRAQPVRSVLSSNQLVEDSIFLHRIDQLASLLTRILLTNYATTVNYSVRLIYLRIQL